MRRLSALAWRSLAARRLRSALTIAGIGLGVGVLFAALCLNAAIDASVDRTVTTVLGNAQVRVSAFDEIGLSSATQQAVAGVPGVAVAAPRVERQTYLQSAAGSGPALRPPVTVLGVDPTLDALVHPQVVVRGDPLVAGSSGALISNALARQDGLEIGSTLTVLGPFDPAQSTLTVIGILAGTGPLPTADDRVVVVTLDRATALFGLGGVSRIDLLLDPGAVPQVVAGRIEQRIHSQPYVISGPSDMAGALRASTADFQATTALIAAISLFVGAFLIFNTLSMTVAERVRELALLRAAGATRDQVYWLVLLQALALGLFGSILGVGLGQALAIWMGGSLSGQAAAVGSLAIPMTVPTPAAVVLAIMVGLAVTLAAAVEPAWRAGQISPVEALKQRPELTHVSAARLRWLIAVFAVVGLVGLLLWPRGAPQPGLLGSLLVYGLLLVATLLSPFLLPVLARAAGLPFALLLRAEERLARGALVRVPTRTALTVGSLSIGLAMIVALAAVGQSDRRAATAWLADVVPGDEIATSIRPVGLDEGIQADLSAVPGVERVSPIGRFDLAYEGVRLDGVAMSGANLLADGRLTFVGGDRRVALAALDEGGTVILPLTQANRLGLRLGDRMTFTTSDGRDTQMRVAGVVARSLPGRTGEALLVSWSDATAQFGVQGADAFAIRFATGAAGRAQSLVEDEARALALEPNPIDAVQGAVGETLARVFGLFDGLAAIAVIVAGLGIVNTLTMNVMERVREIGVLRAVGMTRRQVWRMVVVEAGIVGVVGALLGCLTGVAAGLLMIGLAGGSGGSAGIEIPWLTIMLAGAFGVGVAILAAAYPARLASEMSIVRAVQYE